MTANTTELIKGRETVAVLLDELGIDAYLFEVEPRDDAAWELRLECAVASGWERVVFTVQRDRLLQCLEDGTIRRELSAQLGDRLKACVRHSH